ncbi:hypothetical protein HYZ97_04510 [Candidatus Pacearchaeota archaeon]|nr:hypothetical protein [Candidatus Pacearchaeota archaeon]
MAKKEVFLCDHCSKQSQSLTHGSEVPYSLGWRSLTNFEFKASSEFRHESILKHFCSNACLLAFIEKFVYEQEDQLQVTISKAKPEKKALPLPLITHQFSA